MHVKEEVSVKNFVERVVIVALEKITIGVMDQRKTATVPLVQLVQFIQVFTHVRFQ